MIIKFNGRPISRIETEMSAEEVEEYIGHARVTAVESDPEADVRGGAPQRVLDSIEELKEDEP